MAYWPSPWLFKDFAATVSEIYGSVTKDRAVVNNGLAGLDGTIAGETPVVSLSTSSYQSIDLRYDLLYRIHISQFVCPLGLVRI